MDIRKYVTARVAEFKASYEYALMLEAAKAYKNGERREDAAICPDLRRQCQRKVNYFLGRPYTVTNAPDYASELQSPKWLSLLRDTAKEMYRSGIAYWEAEPDATAVTGYRPVLRKAQHIIPIWTSAEHEAIEAYIYLFTKTVIKKDTSVMVVEYADYVTLSGRFRVNLSDATTPVVRYPHAVVYVDNKPVEDILFNALPLIPIKLSDDETSLYKLMVGALEAYDEGLKLLRKKINKNATSPVWEIANYAATDEDSHEAIRHNLEQGIVLTTGNGGVKLHAQALDTITNEAYLNRLRKAIHEASATVDRDREFEYAASGKALDRMYVDMDADARDIADQMQEGMQAFIAFVHAQGGKDETQLTVVWNMDKVTDEPAVITAIVQSKGTLSDETLLEQHPWVKDVKEEQRRLKKQKEENEDIYGLGNNRIPTNGEGEE